MNSTSCYGWKVPCAFFWWETHWIALWKLNGETKAKGKSKKGKSKKAKFCQMRRVFTDVGESGTTGQGETKAKVKRQKAKVKRFQVPGFKFPGPCKNSAALLAGFQPAHLRRRFWQRKTFFSKLVGQGKNMTITLVLSIVRLSHDPVGHPWDSGTV